MFYTQCFFPAVDLHDWLQQNVLTGSNCRDSNSLKEWQMRKHLYIVKYTPVILKALCSLQERMIAIRLYISKTHTLSVCVTERGGERERDGPIV